MRLYAGTFVLSVYCSFTAKTLLNAFAFARQVVQEAVDHALPVAVVVRGGVPVDRVDVAAMDDRVACGVGERIRFGFFFEYAEGVLLQRSVEQKLLVARLQPDGRATHCHHDGARARGGESETGESGDEEAGEQAHAARRGEQAGGDGHDTLIGIADAMP